jgi:hypothetical protein
METLHFIPNGEDPYPKIVRSAYVAQDYEVNQK